MRVRLAALAIALLSATPATPATPAYAASEPLPLPGSSGCSYVVTSRDDAAGTASGFLHGSVAVADLPHRDGATSGPAGVTLTCSLHTTSYGYPSPADSAASAGGVTAAVLAPTPFTVPQPDGWHTANLCSRVDVTDATGTTTYWLNSDNGMWGTDPACDDGAYCTSVDENCTYSIALQKWLLGTTTDEVVDDVIAESAVLDDTLCPRLAERAPGVPGVVDVTPEGDVYVAGELFWDCPPYA